MNLQSKLIFFIDDSSIIISHPETGYFQNQVNDVSDDLNKWFIANKLTSNFDKTNVMKLCTSSKTCINLNIGYDNKIKNIPKLSSGACFAMRAVTPLMKIEILKLVYFTYFHSTFYDNVIIFWDIHLTAKMSFLLIQKKIARIRARSKRRVFHWGLFKYSSVATEFLL
jgi:hypothetical protein